MKKHNLTGYPSIDKPWLKYYSEEAINSEIPNCLVYDLIWERNKEFLNNIALSYYGHDITFQEMFDEIEKAASAFTAIGVKKGDIIAMITVTTPETVYALYGLNRLGAIPNMIDPRTSVEGIREYIAEVNAKYILSLDLSYKKVMQAVEGLSVHKVILVSPADSMIGLKRSMYHLSALLKGNNLDKNYNFIPWKKFIFQGLKVKPKYETYTENQCCLIVHTGGTTGLPKSVMLSNENINALVVQSIDTQIDMKREHSWLNIMPPFIAYGFGMGLHLPLTIGMKMILIPSFNSKHFDKLLLKYKPIHVLGVPSSWGPLLNSSKLKKADLSYMIAPTVGGDKMDIILEQKANEFLKKHHCTSVITKGYGMTEVSAGVAGTVDENNEIGSVGIPFSKTIIAIFDVETGEELPYYEAGEICICSPNTMLGYYNNVEATNDIVRIHSDGKKWVHSGDIGYMNENGSLFIIDRIKRMIIRHDGFKIFPSLIEKNILKIENVNSCCVVGIQDKGHVQGKLPVAYIVLKSETCNRKIVEKQIIEICKSNLPEYAQPIVYKFREDLPLTPIGKIDYRELIAIAEGQMEIESS